MMGGWIVAPGRCRLPRQPDRGGQLVERQSAKKRPLAAFAAKSEKTALLEVFARGLVVVSVPWHLRARDQRFSSRQPSSL